MARRRPRKGRRQAATAKSKFNPSKLREKVDTYIDAIYAVLALVNHARWDDAKRVIREDIQYGVGRRFATSAANKRTPNAEVTPDVAIQLTPTLGLIAEAKPGVARSREIWQQNLQQLTKYDDDLEGWWTKNGHVASHDLMVMLPLPRATAFVDLVEAQLSNGELKFTRPFTVVSFVKSTTAEKTWVILQGHHGTFGKVSDATLKEKLRQNIPIDWQLLLTKYRDVRFIDTEPPLPYVLYLLWELVFTTMASGKLKAGQAELEVTVEALTAQLQEYYGFRSTGPRAIEVPRRSWVRHALDALVAFNMATRHTDQSRKTERYRVHYRRYRMKDGSLMFFGRLENKHHAKLARLDSRKPILEIAESNETPTGVAATAVTPPAQQPALTQTPEEPPGE